MNHGTRLPSAVHHLRSGLLALLACAALNASAQTTAPADAFDRFLIRVTGAGQQTVGFGTGGVPVASPTAHTLSTNGGPNLQASVNGTLTNPSGNPVAITGRGTIPPSKFVPLLKKALAIAPVLGTGVALYDLATEVGFTPFKDSSGNLIVTQPDPAACTTGSCYQYRYTVENISGSDTTPWFSNPQSACSALVPLYISRTCLGCSINGSGVSGTSCVINASFQGSNFGDVFPAQTQEVPPSSGSSVPSSLDALADAIAQKSGWPTSSALPRAVLQSVQLTGEKLTPETPTVTGPASSPGKQAQKQNPDGTTTTQTVTHNHTYQGPNITTTTVTVTNNYNPTTNTTTTTTETDTPALEEQPASECEKNPDTLGCQKLGDVPEAEQIAREQKDLTYTPDPVSWGASASCPQPITIGMVAGEARALEFTPFCDVAQDARPFILMAGALLAIFILVGALRT